MKTLRKGDRGNEVKELQTALNGAGSNLTVDGVFGNDTHAAVIAFQIAHKLTIDGIVGAKTWEALTIPTNTQLYNAFKTCLDAIEQLPEFKQLYKMLGGV